MRNSFNISLCCRRYFLTGLFSIISFVLIYSQNYTISGKVIEKKQKTPIGYALVTVTEKNLWGTTDDKGEFIIRNIPVGKTRIQISSLGYVTTSFEVNLIENHSGLIFEIEEDNLLLNEVVVTAKQNKGDMSTSYTIDRTVLDHTQMLNISDLNSLLPGGSSNTRIHLATNDPQQLEIRTQGDTEMGNVTFGSAIEVDGIRLSNNSSFADLNNSGGLRGVDVRSIGTSNIESIEIVTGIASVEYGDLSNGLVKINTRKGKSPFTFDITFEPNTKQYALNKGFDLGNKSGVLNTAFERTRSIRDLASPYISYVRNNLSLQYSNTLNPTGAHPLQVMAGVSGNIGGYNDEADPDLFTETYTKQKDNTIRGNIEFKWLINKPWLTNIEASASVSYADKLTKVNTNRSSSSSTVAMHAIEEGYYIAEDYDKNPDALAILRPAGYWYELQYTDDKPITYNAKIKAVWSRNFGPLQNRFMIGSDFSRSGNKGKGVYYNDMRYAPSWREYSYNKLPYMNNLSLFAEDKVSIPVYNSIVEFMAGIRSDMTHIKGSEYGRITSMAPRLNAKLKLNEFDTDIIQDIVIRAGWGKSVKLPGFQALFPAPDYSNSDIQTFAPGTMADGTTYYAYYNMPTTTLTNTNLKWQHTIQKELGIEFRIKKTSISVSGYHSKVINPYIRTNVYSPFTYKLTDQSSLNNNPIPSENRTYYVDQTTGIVTVTDNTGVHSDMKLDYRERSVYKNNRMYINGSPSVRKGIEWVINFVKIPALNTSFQIDGNYYYYKGVEETIVPYTQTSGLTSSDGSPYKYVGFYVGSGTSNSNGSISKKVNNNLTVTTHIPAIRLIISARIEGHLYNYSQNLSEYSGGNRSFILDSAYDYFPSETATGSIYGGDHYVGMYPLYYAGINDMNTLIPFEEAFRNAKENDQDLYNDLAKMVNRTSYSYSFNPNKTSVYFGTNIRITKEIGNFLSISFNAVNFTNSLKKIKNSQTDWESTVHNNGIGNNKYSLPSFYYGLSLRLKL